jgi:hypothetical protein
MRENRKIATRGGRPRKLKLWHITVVVLLASLILGGFKALTRGSNPSETDVFLGFLGIWIVACLALLVVSFGMKQARRANQWLKEWAVVRGGLLGFGVWMVGIGIDLAIIVGAIGIALVLIIGLVKLLLSLHG